MKRISAICLLALALAPTIACASHDAHLSPRTGTTPARDSATVTAAVTVTETAVLAASGLGLVLMGWAWRRSTRRQDSGR